VDGAGRAASGALAVRDFTFTSLAVAF